MEAIKEGKQISEVARKLKRRRGDTHVVENVREKGKKGERERNEMETSTRTSRRRKFN